MPEPTLRPMVPADLPKLRQLFESSFGHRRDEAYDQWRYLRTPDGLAPTVVAVEDSRFAGSYTVSPTALEIGGERVRGAQSLDTMTHPDFRGRGLFTKLALACFERLAADGYEVLYGFPNPMSFPGFVRRLNWDHVTDVPYWARPILPLEGKPEPLPGLSGLLSRVLFRSPGGGPEVRTDRPPAERIDALIASHTGSKDLCRIHRDASWYAWRYGPPGQRSYEWLTAYDRNEAIGFAVIGSDVARPRGGEVQLCELIGSPAARVALVRAAVKVCYEASRKSLRTLTNDPEVIEALRPNGFFRRRVTPLIVKPLTARHFRANLHDANAWRIVGGDLDVF